MNRYHSLLLATLSFSAACSRGAKPSAADLAALSTLQATPRVVGSDTTWVTSAPGYEIVGRSRLDIVAVLPQLEGAASVLRRVYPRESLPKVVIALRRVPDEGKPFVPVAPVPSNMRDSAIEVVLPNAKMLAEARERGGPSANQNPAAPAVRVWLMEHEKKLAAGARMPGWFEAAIPALASDSLTDHFIAALAVNTESLVPLTQLFAADRSLFAAGPGRGGENGEEDRAGRAAGGRGERGGGIGGMGGRGGSRGGMGGGGGRGGAAGGGSGGGRSGGGRAGSRGGGIQMQGGALFSYEAAAVGRFLEVRHGYEFIGNIADLQANKASIDTLLAQQSMTVQQLEINWQNWFATASRRVPQ